MKELLAYISKSCLELRLMIWLSAQFYADNIHNIYYGTHLCQNCLERSLVSSV